MEHFDVVATFPLCISFKSTNNGKIIHLNKKWIKKNFNVEPRDVISMDNTDDGQLIFNTLHHDS